MSCTSDLVLLPTGTQGSTSGDRLEKCGSNGYYTFKKGQDNFHRFVHVDQQALTQHMEREDLTCGASEGTVCTSNKGDAKVDTGKAITKLCSIVNAPTPVVLTNVGAKSKLNVATIRCKTGCAAGFVDPVPLAICKTTRQGGKPETRFYTGNNAKCPDGFTTDGKVQLIRSSNNSQSVQALMCTGKAPESAKEKAAREKTEAEERKIEEENKRRQAAAEAKAKEIADAMARAKDAAKNKAVEKKVATPESAKETQGAPTAATAAKSGATAADNGAEFVGCFRDNINGKRDLPIHGPQDLKDPDAVKKCQEFAKSKGKKYFGLQYNTQCFAGDSYGSMGGANANVCNQKCTGRGGQSDGQKGMCGAGNTNMVFRTEPEKEAPTSCEGLPEGNCPDGWTLTQYNTGGVQCKPLTPEGRKNEGSCGTSGSIVAGFPHNHTPANRANWSRDCKTQWNNCKWLTKVGEVAPSDAYKAPQPNKPTGKVEKHASTFVLVDKNGLTKAKADAACRASGSPGGNANDLIKDAFFNAQKPPAGKAIVDCANPEERAVQTGTVTLTYGNVCPPGSTKVGGGVHNHHMSFCEWDTSKDTTAKNKQRTVHNFVKCSQPFTSAHVWLPVHLVTKVDPNINAQAYGFSICAK